MTKLKDVIKLPPKIDLSKSPRGDYSRDAEHNRIIEDIGNMEVPWQRVEIRDSLYSKARIVRDEADGDYLVIRKKDFNEICSTFAQPVLERLDEKKVYEACRLGHRKYIKAGMHGEMQLCGFIQQEICSRFSIPEVEIDVEELAREACEITINSIGEILPIPDTDDLAYANIDWKKDIIDFSVRKAISDNLKRIVK